MQLGSFSRETPVFLAPMAGVTDLPMRQLAVEYGADVAVGEMMSADLSLASSRKSSSRAQHSKAAGLHSIQLVGNNPDVLAQAARYNVDQGAQVIDINMGCPAKKVCKKAAGSALLADPALVRNILEATINAVSVPVTLKIRTGISQAHRNGVEIAEIAQDCGIAMLTVHGRTRADKFNGAAEYETLRQIVQAVDIPVLANGDIDSPEKARQVLDHTGATGVMVGRAAQGRLWLPGLIAQSLSQGVAVRPCTDERFDILKRHVHRLHAFHGAIMGYKIARKHVNWFLEAEAGHDYRALRASFNALPSPDAQEAFLRDHKDFIFELIRSTEGGNTPTELAA